MGYVLYCVIFEQVMKVFKKMALHIPKEGLQRSPEEASKDKKAVQRVESKPKGLCVCVCVCVWVPLSLHASLWGCCLKGHSDFIF